MTPTITGRVGFVFLLSAIAVLLFSIYRSSRGGNSVGLSSLGTVLLVLGLALRVSASRIGGK